MNLKLILINHIEQKRILEVLNIIDNCVDDCHDFLLLRALLREYVNDLAAAYLDIENYFGDYEFIKDITKARILAKLGYLDQSKDILIKYPLINVPKEQLDSNGIPYTIGIVYHIYDLERMNIYKIKDFLKCVTNIENEVLRNFLIYSMFMNGAFETIQQIFSESFTNEKLERTVKRLMLYDSLLKAEHVENEKKEIRNILKNIRGWLSIDEGLYLWNLAKFVCNKENIVEIGSFHGRSTICLAHGSLQGKNAMVYSIDPHKGIECYGDNVSFETLKDNLKSRKLCSNTRLLVDTSLSASKKWSNGQIGLLFIDALHDYENVKSDFISWSEYLSDGSFVVFHDSVQPGVNKLILEILENFEEFEPLGLRDSLFVFKKSTQNNNREKNQFFITYLKEKGEDHNIWIERDMKNILNFSTYLLKKMEI